MAKLNFLFTSFGFLLLVQTLALDTSITIGGDATLGKTANITCRYFTSLGENVFAFSIWRLPRLPNDDKGFIYNISKLGVVKKGKLYHGRLSIDVTPIGTSGNTPVTQSATMSISKIVCVDSGLYMCEFAYLTPGQLVQKTSTTLRLHIKAPPSTPTLTLETTSVHPTTTQVWVYEKTTVVAKCNANLGAPELGIFEWRVYRGKQIEYIDGNDNRLSSLKEVQLEPNEQLCTVRMEQRLSIQLFRQNEPLSIACFVHNSHFPRNRPPGYCESKSTDQCDVTLGISVIPVFNEDDEYKMILTYTCILIAGLFTTLVVELRASKCFSMAKPAPSPPTPELPEIDQPLKVPIPIDVTDLPSFEETETVVTEDNTSIVTAGT